MLSERVRARVIATRLESRYEILPATWDLGVVLAQRPTYLVVLGLWE